MAKAPKPTKRERREPQFASSWRKTAGGRNNRRRRTTASGKKEEEKKTYPASIQIAVGIVAVLFLLLLGLSLWTFPVRGPSQDVPSISEPRGTQRHAKAGKPRRTQEDLTYEEEHPAGWGYLPEDGAVTRAGKQRYRNMTYEEEPEETEEEDRSSGSLAGPPAGEDATVDYE